MPKIDSQNVSYGFESVFSELFSSLTKIYFPRKRDEDRWIYSRLLKGLQKFRDIVCSKLCWHIRMTRQSAGEVLLNDKSSGASERTYERTIMQCGRTRLATKLWGSLRLAPINL